MCKNTTNNCICDILKAINMLQRNAETEDDCINSCDRPRLGQFTCLYYNTRPVILYTCNSNGTTPWQAPTTRTANPDALSSVFRVEKVDDCCATFRVLIVNEDDTFTSTESFFTMNLDCICAIRCLGDTLIDNV